MPEEVLILAVTGIFGVGIVALGGILGWIHTTKVKIKNGYPLESMWGKPLHPQITNEAQERVALLTQENAQLRAELGAVKDRIANVERIVTDSGYRLTHDIERLRGEQEAN